MFIWFPKRRGSRKTELPETPSRTPCLGAVLPHPPSRIAACQELLEHLPALQEELTATTEPELFEDGPSLALQLQQRDRPAARRPRVVYYRQDAPAPLPGTHLSLVR